MIRYKTHPGVVLCEIAGEFILVAAKAALETCPYVTQINESSAFLWRRLEQGSDLDSLEAAVEEEYEVEDPGAVREAVSGFVRQMMEMNYLIPEETEG